MPSSDKPPGIYTPTHSLNCLCVLCDCASVGESGGRPTVYRSYLHFTGERRRGGVSVVGGESAEGMDVVQLNRAAAAVVVVGPH